MAAAVVQQVHDSEISLQSSPAQGWAFPGPSSKYHTRERSRTHIRANSTVTQSEAPLLHTERRAHRRAQSSYAIPTLSDVDRSKAAQHYFRLHSRRSYHIQSPTEHRSPLSRFSSFDSANSATMNHRSSLSTPAKSPTLSRKHSIVQDSPFSDYCTDESRSTDGVIEADTQELLLRLNKLSTSLIRGGNDYQALHIVDKRMKEMETDIAALLSQTRQPPELDDSGLFLEEDERRDSGLELHEDTKLGAIEDQDEADVKTTPNALIDREHLLCQLKDLLTPMKRLNEELQQRYDEVREINAQNEEDLAGKDLAIQKLRSDLQHMKTDRELTRADLITHRSRIVSQVGQIKQLPRAAAEEALTGMRLVAESLHGMVNAFDGRTSALEAEDKSEDAMLQAKHCQWTQEVVKNADGSVLKVVYRSFPSPVPFPSETSTLLNYIDSVKEIITEKPLPKYVSMGTDSSELFNPKPTSTYVSTGTDSAQPRPKLHPSVYVSIGTQTQGLALDSWRDDSSITSSSFDMDNSGDFDEDFDDLPRARPVLVQPDGEVYSCAITTAPSSESEEPSFGLSRFIGAMTDFVDDASEHEAASEHKPARKVARHVSDTSGEHDSKPFWDQLMEIAGFIEH